MVGLYEYSPFGEVVFSKIVGSVVCDFTYTGQEWDADLGLMNYKARMYDPRSLRFLSPDPLNQYPSPYAYVGNNPISLVDPSGMNGILPPRELDFTPQPESGSGTIGAPYVITNPAWARYSATVGGSTNFTTASGITGNYKTGAELAMEEFDRQCNNIQVLIYSGYTNESWKSALYAVRDSYGNTIGWDLDESKLESIDLYLNLTMPGSLLPGENGVNLDDISNALGGFGFATAVGNEIANANIRNQYKSAKSWSGWTKLKNNQQTWRTIRQLGNTGANVLKGFTVAGNITGVITTGYSGYKVTEQLISGGPSNVNSWDLADTVFGGAGVASVYMLAAGASNPIGWAVLGAVAGVYGGVRTGMYIYDQFK